LILVVPNIVSGGGGGGGADVIMNINGKETLWIDKERGWRTGDVDKDSGLSGMKLLDNSHLNSSQNADYAEVDPRNMSTFYRRTLDNPTPYATTMLINSVPQEACSKPSYSEHDIGGGSSGTSSLHSIGGKYCVHSKYSGNDENQFRQLHF